MGNLALGANEPDMKGQCLVGDSFGCDSFQFRDGTFSSGGCKCSLVSGVGEDNGNSYNVSGCGMWPVACRDGISPPQLTPFPFQCFGANKKIQEEPSATSCPPQCQQALEDDFNTFYSKLAASGFEYGSTPIIATDLEFLEDILGTTQCAGSPEKQGKDRLQMGCPTHSAFHFYSTGCKGDPETLIDDFKHKVRKCKEINKKYNLVGTIVNEIGVLKDSKDATCSSEEIAVVMKAIFEYLMTEEGRGVVTEMIWFNQSPVGGTFDLRLIADGKITAAGAQYLQSCAQWAHGAA